MILDKPHIERHGNFYIARDDLIDGGTKRRALLEWLPTLNAKEFYYAGTVFGSGGWALAEACRDLGFFCHLLISKSEYIPGWAEKFSDHIEWHEPSTVMQLHEIALLKATRNDALALPLGFNDPGFEASMVKVFKAVDFTPPELWLPVVSGTLAKAACQVWPDPPIHAVCVAKNHDDLGNMKTYYAPEKYHRPANNMPPYPSHPYSDAKLWQFTSQFALKDALIWNTSR